MTQVRRLFSSMLRYISAFRALRWNARFLTIQKQYVEQHVVTIKKCLFAIQPCFILQHLILKETSLLIDD